jgi:hypothetical protein
MPVETLGKALSYGWRVDRGAGDRALKSVREGRDIIARLKAQAPDNWVGSIAGSRR